MSPDAAERAVPPADRKTPPRGSSVPAPQLAKTPAATSKDQVHALAAKPHAKVPHSAFRVDTSLDEVLTPEMRAALPADMLSAQKEISPYQMETAPFDESGVRKLEAQVAAAQKARRIAEQKRKAELERKRKEEARKKAEAERKRKEEAKRIAEHKRKEEEARQKAEQERKRKEAEAKRLAEEQRKAEEARKLAAQKAEPEPAPAPKPEAEKPAPQKPAEKDEKKVAKAPEPKPAAKKSSTAYARPGGKLETDPAVLADPKAAKALEQFKHFALEWLAKNNRSYIKGTRENVKVTQQGGTYVAQYMMSEPSSLETLVKPSEYKHTPFIGVMRYEEKIFRAEGPTPEAAKSGTFQEIDSTRVTEIFRYAKNKWQY